MNRGVDPNTKVGGRISMYAVHEYQASKAGAIIESDFGGYGAFLFPFILSHPLLFCPAFFN